MLFFKNQYFYLWLRTLSLFLIKKLYLSFPGYGYDSAAYGSQSYPYMTGQVYGGYDMTRGYSPTSTSTPSYMNGSYSSAMYASAPSPYSMTQVRLKLNF